MIVRHAAHRQDTDMQESCTTTETQISSTGSSTALSSGEGTEDLSKTTPATTNQDVSLLSTQTTTPQAQQQQLQEEEPARKRVKKKPNYYPAPKSRSKPWARPRGSRGWIKKAEAEANAQTSLEVPSECTSTRTTTTTTTTTVTTHVCTESQAPRQLFGLSDDLELEGMMTAAKLCAMCAGAPCGFSVCECKHKILVPTKCAHCLGAPTGSGVCTCASDMMDSLLRDCDLPF
jgi:hypothetical protein